MSDEPFVVTGSAVVSFIVVNQIKEHYLAASELLAGKLNREGMRFWILGQVLDACSKAIENAVDRVSKERKVHQHDREKVKDFRLRVCQETGLSFGPKALAQLKTLTDHWNKHKHSGKGKDWTETANLRTFNYVVDCYHLTTAVVAACYRLFNRPEEPEWLRRAEIQQGEIVLHTLSSAELEQLMANWDIAVTQKGS